MNVDDKELLLHLKSLLFRVDYKKYDSVSIENLKKCVVAVLGASMRQRRTLNMDNEIAYLLDKFINDSSKLPIVVAFIAMSFGIIQPSTLKKVENSDVALIIIDLGIPLSNFSTKIQEALLTHLQLVRFIKPLCVD